MSEPAALHAVPRHPHAWAVCALVLHLAVALAWWRLGWQWGLGLLMALHLAFVWGTLRPGSRLFGPVRCRFPTAQREVWLTIDDGPSAETPAILDLLDRHGARATFFLVGERAQARPDLVHAIATRGHGIGNHSQTHPQARFWALGPRAMRREILDCQRALAALTGTPPRWFRAVVGHANPFVHAPLREAGLSRLAWSARGYDAVESDPARITAAIARDLAPGAIVLLHEAAPHGRSVEIIAAVLGELDRAGYRAVVPEG
ncbi:polysaccharide deacetylase family protein [Luteimonas sp. MC1750]|uniref:polysaccharide deacetylase family protein n=1 Tax=Luteimonas sp. MC1750 TaxID=2799326 RepID=UPI0018F0A58C|nr:polysaccharide deacetylase family protein [Luteimonas sp. MC1750]MBJ6983271.1 polysaccharide deacetylase family protein [Luteimonas sp. MC1750]QQO06138.1 polysaccharide deacetylase family protein [Luteimonas sp. MC1750]